MTRTLDVALAPLPVLVSATLETCHNGGTEVVQPERLFEEVGKAPLLHLLSGEVGSAHDADWDGLRQEAQPLHGVIGNLITLPEEITENEVKCLGGHQGQGVLDRSGYESHIAFVAEKLAECLSQVLILGDQEQAWRGRRSTCHSSTPSGLNREQVCERRPLGAGMRVPCSSIVGRVAVPVKRLLAAPRGPTATAAGTPSGNPLSAAAQSGEEALGAALWQVVRRVSHDGQHLIDIEGFLERGEVQLAQEFHHPQRQRFDRC